VRQLLPIIPLEGINNLNLQINHKHSGKAKDGFLHNSFLQVLSKNCYKFLYLIFSAAPILFFLPLSNAYPAQATLAWDPNPANPNPIAGYKVYYGNSSRNYQSVIDVGDSTTCTIPNLVNERTYYFAVTNYDTFGKESGYSNEVIYSSVPPPPASLYTDILWRNTATGQIMLWYMNGVNITSSANIGTVPPPWQIQGIGDFNNDGKPDILWRQTANGDVVVWYMNGLNITSSANIGTVSPPWQIEGR
jgi:hypothetical protein